MIWVVLCLWAVDGCIMDNQTTSSFFTFTTVRVVQELRCPVFSLATQNVGFLIFFFHSVKFAYFSEIERSVKDLLLYHRNDQVWNLCLHVKRQTMTGKKIYYSLPFKWIMPINDSGAVFLMHYQVFLHYNIRFSELKGLLILGIT